MNHVTYIKNADPLTEVQRTSVSHGRHYWGKLFPHLLDGDMAQAHILLSTLAWGRSAGFARHGCNLIW
jgi:hypothetical protein